MLRMQGRTTEKHLVEVVAMDEGPQSRLGCLQEYVIIELQGDLLSKSNSALGGSFIGDLHFTKENIPILIVGHHILYGTYVTLDKPLAVLHKQQSQCTKEDDLFAREQPTIQSTEYCAQAVIRRKLVFRQRSKPIVIKQ